MNQYPPGCSSNDIDQGWEDLHQMIDNESTAEGWSECDAEAVWKMGKSAWNAIHEMGGGFPHEGFSEANTQSPPTR